MHPVTTIPVQGHADGERERDVLVGVHEHLRPGEAEAMRPGTVFIPSSAETRSHQSWGLISPSASPRMTSVDDCRPGVSAYGGDEEAGRERSAPFTASMTGS